MISRAFFAESAPLRRLGPLQKQKTRYLCNFFAITDSSLLLQARKQPFLLHFRAAIRVLAPRDNPQSQKSCNPSRLFVSGFLGGGPEPVLERYRPDTGRGCARCGAGWTRYSVGVLSERRAMCCPGAAGVLLGCGIVMWPRCGVTKHGWRCGLGRLPAYRAASLLSRKISNATLLKLVFRYNGRRGFVEDQASD